MSILAGMVLEPSSPAQAYVADAKTAARHASELVAQMLAYAGKGSSRSESIDLSALVREMAELLSRPIAHKTTVRFDSAPGPLITRGDPTQIRQIVMNLITNAAQAIGDDPGQITVSAKRVECDRAFLDQIRPDQELPAGSYLRLQVSDTGLGMDERILERIFDPFFTTKSKGSGLGLSAVHGIVRSHGGAIRVESEMGKGSIFTLWLPASSRASTAPTPEKRANGPSH